MLKHPIRKLPMYPIFITTNSTQYPVLCKI